MVQSLSSGEGLTDLVFVNCDAVVMLILVMKLPNCSMCKGHSWTVRSSWSECNTTNQFWGMFVHFWICIVVIHFMCDGLITRPEESYRVSVCVWSRNPEKGGQRSILDYKHMWMNEYTYMKGLSCLLWFGSLDYVICMCKRARLLE
jgi:hypothetical protein